MTVTLGAHVDQADPIAEAKARGTTLVQFFLGDPQGYKGPAYAYAGGADGLRDDAAAAGIDLYVHSPYLINVATTNNRIRIPGRKLLQQHIDGAASIGAKGLIVHGGHLNKDEDPAIGFDNWRKAVEATDLKIPLLIENTAGGDNAMTRYLDRIAGVWDAIGSASGSENVGFCLDTCHAHAGGNSLETVVKDVLCDHRPDRPRALQRQPRRVRLRRGPAHQPRQRHDRPGSARFGRPRRGRTRHLRDPRWRRRTRRRPRLAARAPLRTVSRNRRTARAADPRQQPGPPRPGRPQGPGRRRAPRALR